ncbi:Cysteine-rich receptor-like protein kinase 29 [Abeliophyllum distichum]|uniref:Cysteine-rich receptor-like protein kinase 29 n=1 Tax=Abeliophyllum distichum TaxID=126358 RepID=A0ABD1NSC2_9LAMI
MVLLLKICIQDQLGRHFVVPIDGIRRENSHQFAEGKLPKGNEIAVKRLSQGSVQGDMEFKNEALLVARLQHRSLVRLLGFSVQGTERLLIYELVKNGSLDSFIFDAIKRSYLDCEKRFKIIMGIARGLLYLHEESRLKIIHRDLKASNILLDKEMNPNISDFGMARLFVQDESQGNTSRIAGTYGYMPPEYVIYGQFSTKSDIFSFGVLVLEIVTGQRINSYQNGDGVETLLNFAWKNWQEGTSENIIDPTLRASSSSLRDIVRCIHISLLCVQENMADRPTIGSVVLMLTSFSTTLPVPLQPTFFVSSYMDPEILNRQDYNSRLSDIRTPLEVKPGNSTPLSTNDVSLTELYPR